MILSRMTFCGRLVRLMLFFGILLCSIACSDVGESIPVITEVRDVNGASLGSVAIPAACSPEASLHLRRGVALIHNMTYIQAEAEFRAATVQDEHCALAYWGMAMTYVHPLWPDVPPDDKFEQGAKLLTEARAQGRLGGREEVYFAALEAYYQDGTVRSEKERLASFLQGWDHAHAAYPDDLEIQLFRALALSAVATTSTDRVEKQIEAGEMAENVLAEMPDHTGALHYIIHAYDLPELASRALPAARIYGELATGNAHALHMTSHIFTREGLWKESITYNQRSAEAALRHPINGLTSFHYLHAADYLAYAYLQRFDDTGAQKIWDAMVSMEPPAVNHPASAYAFAAVPARIALERQDWRAAARLQSRWPSTITWDRFPQFEAIAEFARGLGSARSGDLTAAGRAVSRLDELQALSAALPGAYNWGEQVQIQQVTVNAWIAFSKGQKREALARMNEAADLEASTRKNPVTPGEVLPAAELLGDMLLALDRYDEARLAYESALKRSPNRANSLFGAGRAAELAGDIKTARGFYEQLVTTARVDSDHEQLRHARKSLAAD